MSVIRVAIVGGGSAGLSMAQQLVHVAPERFAPVIFESRERVGGLWCYDRAPGPCSVHVSDAQHTTGYASWDAAIPASAMYDGLYTNIPSDIMAYRDAPFSRQTPLFPQRAQVLDYLESFAREQDLLRYVRFKTHVERVAKCPTGWQVTSRAFSSGEVTEEHFDCVVAANGRCSIPNVPYIPGIANYKGLQLHSAWYRYPDAFRGQTVLIVGNNSSGGDIARELCGGVKRVFPGSDDWNASGSASVTVYQVYRDPESPPPMDYDPRSPDSPAWCRRINVVGPITRITDDGRVETATGEVLSVDTIIWATGFLYSFPYLDHAVEPFATHPVVPLVGDEHTRVAADAHAASIPHNLDDWFLFYRHDNSLCFLGLPNRIVPFPFTQLQSRIAAHVWLGRIPALPGVRSSLGPDDPARWQLATHDSPKPLVDLTFGAESEHAYHDALLALLPGEQGKQRPPGQEAYIAKGDGRGGGDHAPEGWYQLSQWRRDRRKAGRMLRREQIGY
ncbi:monooxygenase [Malassezia cuniculi]|uniref:Monooxygenase n=1 Tax=Malassezia cuniculi TaxID=948313 RepID=A0AAF0EXD2_9BASI|nr:monooxygenase [Malassezia cuniculi]